MKRILTRWLADHGTNLEQMRATRHLVIKLILIICPSLEKVYLLKKRDEEEFSHPLKEEIKAIPTSLQNRLNLIPTNIPQLKPRLGKYSLEEEQRSILQRGLAVAVICGIAGMTIGITGTIQPDTEFQSFLQATSGLPFDPTLLGE